MHTEKTYVRSLNVIEVTYILGFDSFVGVPPDSVET
jgi:hypothetical protein